MLLRLAEFSLQESSLLQLLLAADHDRFIPVAPADDADDADVPSSSLGLE